MCQPNLVMGKILVSGFGFLVGGFCFGLFVCVFVSPQSLQAVMILLVSCVWRIATKSCHLCERDKGDLPLGASTVFVVCFLLALECIS